MIEISNIYDIDRLMEWRAEVIRNVFGADAEPSLLDANRRYYMEHIADGTHFTITASYDGVECGCGAICLTDELPSPDNPSGRCAYLMNIYVRKAFRNKGIAHAIISYLLHESKSRACGKIYLETTADGKSVYTSLGFRDMPDMMKYYDTENRN